MTNHSTAPSPGGSASCSVFRLILYSVLLQSLVCHSAFLCSCCWNARYTHLLSQCRVHCRAHRRRRSHSQLEDPAVSACLAAVRHRHCRHWRLCASCGHTRPAHVHRPAECSRALWRRRPPWVSATCVPAELLGATCVSGGSVIVLLSASLSCWLSHCVAGCITALLSASLCC